MFKLQFEGHLSLDSIFYNIEVLNNYPFYKQIQQL